MSNNTNQEPAHPYGTEVLRREELVLFHHESKATYTLVYNPKYKKGLRKALIDLLANVELIKEN